MARVRLVWTPEAKEDVRKIRDYVAKDSPGAAKALANRIKETAQRLRDSPLFGAEVPEFGRPEIREVLVGNYRIIYVPGKSAVTILRVFHGSRLLGFENLLFE
mgnify:CR=1 FL=1